MSHSTDAAPAGSWASCLIRSRGRMLLALALSTGGGCGGAGDRTESTGYVPGQAVPASGLVVERGARCGGCSVQISEIGTLGSPNDELQVGDGSAAVMVPVAGCVVGPTDREGEVLFFRRCGRDVSLFGRAGEGPGELGVVRRLARWRGDSVLAFGYGTMVVLSGATGSGRTSRFDPGIQGTNILTIPEDSLVVVNNDHATRPQFTIIRSDGSTGPSFGRPAPLVQRGNPAHNRAALGVGRRSGTLWVVPTFFELALSQWSIDGELLQTLRPATTWFSSYDTVALSDFWARGPRQVRPLPFTRAVHESVDDVLWVAHSIAASDWKAESPSAANERRDGREGGQSSSRSQYFDGMLSAFDPTTGELIISLQIPEPIIGFLADTIAVTRRMDGDGVSQLVLLRFLLTQ